MLHPGAQPAVRASTGSSVYHQPSRARHADGQEIARAIGPPVRRLAQHHLGPPSDWLDRTLSARKGTYKMGLSRWWYLSKIVAYPQARRQPLQPAASQDRLKAGDNYPFRSFNPQPTGRGLGADYCL